MSMHARNRQRSDQRPMGYWCLTVVLGLFALAAPGAPLDLRVQLIDLAHLHGFRVDGADHLQDVVAARVVDGSPMTQLRALLEGVDHIIIQTPNGQVERVLILGAEVSQPPPPRVQIHDSSVSSSTNTAPITLPMQRHGNQHLVQVELEGARTRRLRLTLLVDTGADALVLPASMIARLGLSSADLTRREVQTANGRVHARYGRLPALWLNGRRVTEVAVAFLDDLQLGDHGLLGMSVLGRFRLTIDDQAEQLVLEPR